MREILESDALLTVRQACEFIGGQGRPISAASLYRGVERGRFPAPVKIGPGTSRWIRRELAEALQRLANAA
jgi:predicted DNA-binding transcriptional regulator AlpA